MSQRLIYVMGPSGAGKDSVLGWLRQHLPQGLGVHWARRTITRPEGAGERHEPVTPACFEALDAAGAFALAWRANGLSYGVRHGELAPLQAQGWVLVNGSRGHFAAALARYPGACGLHITAPAAVLRQRLLARGRESAAEVERRVARAAAFEAPPGVIEVRNEGSVEQAGRSVLQALQACAGWPGRAAGWRP
jgi:ribose 1,5-bisphosphokinase